MQLNYNSKMEIKTDNQNSLLKRKEIKGELESENNPNFDEIKKLIASELKKPEETIEVLNIKGGFGKNIFHIDAHIYDSKEDLENIKKLKKTSKQRKEEKSAEKEKKESSEEKPTEDSPKEEQSSEEKPVEKEETTSETKPEEPPKE